ncbi:PfkB family carbohydrate kinase [Bifidobacterium platyrrhinorum]|uniref:Carbohydrate kinase n=1 Tax=Bifidobacterium platyrrhinorum TaxID=2661628 RepID=A0A6L9SP25_9BIFI|nr:PfkB family carbohydrate kinase [Bifidobacterium platyrrhinorum]NEG54260.1 carbohydrate kinase [Bifidobacterium platyrrhinorum]
MGATREPKVLHLAQVVVDLTMRVDHLPERGGDIFATENGISAGGGYNVLYAVRRLGAPAAYMGGIGTGPMADVARKALADIDVPAEGATLTDVDTGYSVAMTEPDGERTFVSTRGAETMVPVDSYERIDLVDGDVVYLCGYSFSHTSNREAIMRFARRNAGWGGTVVFDVSPMVETIPDECLETVGLLHPLWSMNEREGAILTARFGLEPESGSADGGMTDRDRCAALARRFDSPVVLRVGADGAWYGTPDGSVEHVPPYRVSVVDTNGAGDAHAGALCAALFLGRPMREALRLANCAGALSTTHRGPATCPPLDELEAAAATL